MNSKFRLLVALCIAMSFGVLFASHAAAQTKPNIVVIMVDDLDNNVWSTALAEGLLPTINGELYGKGTVFEQMFTSQPLCCPSRATFHTGQYPHNHGVVGNDGFYYQGDKKTGILGYRDTREATALGTWLNKDGLYRTGHFGKYMNGSGHGDDKTRKVAGWEKWRALVPILKDKDDPSVIPRAVQCMYGYAMANTGQTPEIFPAVERKHQTDQLAKLAADFINPPPPPAPALPDTRPFMLVVTPTAPHTEGCTPTQDETFVQDPKKPGYHFIRTNDLYEADPHTYVELPTADLTVSYDEPEIGDKPIWMRDDPPGAPQDPDYQKRKDRLLKERKQLFNEKMAALRPVDDLVKTVLAALGDKLDNTLIIFTSDNGFQYGTHRADGKQDFYEESTRVPMIIRAPHQTAHGKSQAWVMNNDWAPTIAAYADVTKAVKVDGRSLKNLVEHPNAPGTRKSFLIRTGPNPGITVPVTTDADGEGEAHFPYLAIRTRHRLLTNDDTENTILVYAESRHPDYPGVTYELYNLSVPGDLQVQNIYEAQKDRPRTVRLASWLHKLENCNGNNGEEKPEGEIQDCRWLEDNGPAR